MKTKGKILVTGGAGYIGSHTVLSLVEAGYEPVILDNFSNSDPRIIHQLQEILQKDVIVYRGDVTRATDVRNVLKQEENISGVIHFAAFKAVGESVEHPLKYYKNNTVSLITLLEELGKKGISNLVFSSSCTVYGEPEVLPVTENAPIGMPSSPYGDTKQQNESILRNTYLKLNLKVCLLRYFNPIGAHPSGMIGELPSGIPNNLVPYIQQTAAGLRKALTVNGNDYDTKDGTCIRDYIDVVDLAEAHVKALQWLAKEKSPVCEPINIGVGKGYSVLEVINTFEKENKIKIPYKIGPRRSGDVVQIWSDNTKAKKLFKWKPRYSLSDSLKHAWKWQRYHDANWNETV